MGIQGLLTQLRPIIDTNYHVSRLSGKRVAVDGYAWLHRAAYTCVSDLANGNESIKWIQYCLSRIDMLLHFNISIYMVFDGANLPAKSKTEEERLKSRKENLEKGNDYAQKGDDASARSYFSRAIDITPLMAAQLIREIKRQRPGVKCVVAPYEADAQLAFLSVNDLVDAVISEDSDTIPFGCKEILFKLEGNGSCHHLLLKDIFMKTNDGFDMRDFNQEMVISMCIGAGCDYLDSLPNFGIKNSFKMIKKRRTPYMMLRSMRLSGIIPVTVVMRGVASGPGPNAVRHDVLHYELEFYKAFMTFKHQIVYDVVKKQTCHLLPFPSNEDLPPCLQPQEKGGTLVPFDFSFLGTHLSDSLATAIADGLVDPTTHEKFVFQEHIERQLSSTSNTSSKMPSNSLSKSSAPTSVPSTAQSTASSARSGSKVTVFNNVGKNKPIQSYFMSEKSQPEPKRSSSSLLTSRSSASLASSSSSTSSTSLTSSHHSNSKNIVVGSNVPTSKFFQPRRSSVPANTTLSSSLQRLAKMRADEAAQRLSTAQVEPSVDFRRYSTGNVSPADKDNKSGDNKRRRISTGSICSQSVIDLSSSPAYKNSFSPPCDNVFKRFANEDLSIGVEKKVICQVTDATLIASEERNKRTPISLREIVVSSSGKSKSDKNSNPKLSFEVSDLSPKKLVESLDSHNICMNDEYNEKAKKRTKSLFKGPPDFTAFKFG